MRSLIETNRGKIPAILLPEPPGIASDHAKKAFGPEKGPPSSEKFEADSIEGKIVRFKRILGEMRNMAEPGSCRGPAPGPGLEQGPWGLEPAGLCGYPPALIRHMKGPFLAMGASGPCERALSLWTLPSFVGGARPAPAVPGSSMRCEATSRSWWEATSEGARPRETRTSAVKEARRRQPTFSMPMDWPV